MEQSFLKNHHQSRMDMVVLPPCTHSFQFTTKILFQLLPLNYLMGISGNGKLKKKKERKKWMTCSFPLRTPPRSFTCYFHLHPVGQKWIAWSYLAAREATKCNICAWQPCVHLKFDGYICKRRGNTSILYHYNPSVLDSAMLGRFQKNILLCNCNFYVHGHK